MKVLMAVAGVLALLLGLAAAFVVSGAYDVAADVPHRDYTEDLIEMVRERSLQRRIRDIEVPPLDDGTMIAEGAEHYAAMCTGCHLAPGIGKTELRQGLYPRPPDLTQRHARRTPQRAFWVLKHGLKFTGMPAWGTTHDDASLWGIVAFLERLPDLSPEEYARMTRKPEPAPGTPAKAEPPEHDHSTHRH